MKRILFSIILITAFRGVGGAQQDQPDGRSVLPATSEAPPYEVPVSVLTDQRSFSDFLYFPAQGATFVKLSPGFLERHQETVSGSLNYNEKRLGFSVDHGFDNSEWALHGESYFAIADTTGGAESSSILAKGMGDLDFNLRHLTEMNEGRLYYGVDVSVSPGSRVPASVRNGGNFYSGGFSVAPTVAFENSTSWGISGATALYRLKGDRNLAQDNGSETLTGQNAWELRGFSEIQHQSFLFGVAGGVDLVDRGHLITPAGTTSEDPYEALVVSVYGKLAVSPLVNLYPSLAYNNVFTKALNGTEYSRNDDVIGTLGLGLDF